MGFVVGRKTYLFPLRQQSCGGDSNPKNICKTLSANASPSLSFSYAFYFSFHYSATHIPGSLNTASDAISRIVLPLLSSVFPHVNKVANS